MPKFFETDNASTVKRWEVGLEREWRDKTPLLDSKNGMAGKENTRLIVLKDDLTKKAGDLIRSTFKYGTRMRGRAGAEKLEGYEGTYETSTHDLKINVVRGAVGVTGEMNHQRVEWEPMEEAGDALSDWAAVRFSQVLHMHATGWYLATEEPYRFHNAINQFSGDDTASDYFMRPNGKTEDENLTTSDGMSLAFLDKIQKRIKLVRPYIRPARIPGLGDRYVVWLAPEQVAQLRAEDSQWYALMRAGMQGGVFQDNPLLRNSLGEYPPYVFFEESNLPPGIHSTQSAIVNNTRRGWVGGAGSLFLGFGRGVQPGGYGLNRFRFDDVERDFGADLSVGITTIVGCSRPEYTKPGEAVARPHGCIGFSTYAPHEMSDATVVYENWLDIDGVSMAV